MPEDRSVLDRPGPAPTESWPYGEGPDAVVDAYAPSSAAGARPGVVLVHGGFWRPAYDRTHLRPMAAALAADGYSTFLVEYRRDPGHPDATVADVRAAVAVLRERAGAADGLVLVGHSAGGHLALLTAVEAGVTGCLALAAVSDLALAERLHLDDDAVPSFLARPAADRPDLDPARNPRPCVATTLVHGEKDSIVPARLSTSYCSDHAARLVLLPQAAHYELIDPLSSAWPTVMAELATLAAPSGIE